MAAASLFSEARFGGAVAALCLALVAAPVSSATADDPHAGYGAHADHAAHMGHAAQATRTNAVKLDVPDVELLDQDGQPGRFVSERIGERYAAITFTFTTCTTICPVLDGISKRLQKDLGEDLGEEVVLLTVSIDPARDIPERLKQHADKLGARPGWSFLTGETGEVTRLLRALEVWAPNIEDHPPVVYVVDGHTGTWTRLSGFPKPDTILAVIDRYRGAEEAVAHIGHAQ
jgi:protein SCO1/2